MPSIEILVEEPNLNIKTEWAKYAFALVCSSPPESHRCPSLWQQKLSALGGTLFHLGQSSCKDETAYFYYAYGLLDENDHTYFRFNAEFKYNIFQFLNILLQTSKNGRMHFTSDWQWSQNTPETFSKPFTFDEFREYHDKSGIRFNTWITIVQK